MKSQRHSETSVQAAVAIEDRAGTLRARVYEFIRLQHINGATDQEIQQRLSMDPSTERPRRIELVASQKVIDSGKQRKTLSGRAAVVWICKEFVSRPANQTELF